MSCFCHLLGIITDLLHPCFFSGCISCFSAHPDEPNGTGVLWCRWPNLRAVSTCAGSAGRSLTPSLPFRSSGALTHPRCRRLVARIRAAVSVTDTFAGVTGNWPVCDSLVLCDLSSLLHVSELFLLLPSLKSFLNASFVQEVWYCIDWWACSLSSPLSLCSQHCSVLDVQNTVYGWCSLHQICNSQYPGCSSGQRIAFQRMNYVYCT